MCKWINWSYKNLQRASVSNLHVPLLHRAGLKVCKIGACLKSDTGKRPSAKLQQHGFGYDGMVVSFCFPGFWSSQSTCWLLQFWWSDGAWWSREDAWEDEVVCGLPPNQSRLDLQCCKCLQRLCETFFLTSEVGKTWKNIHMTHRYPHRVNEKDRVRPSCVPAVPKETPWQRCWIRRQLAKG